MNGIVVVNKPADITSRDVVNILCKKFNTKKVGHTGTLDPMATGVLVILIGKYTNLVEIITNADKTYEATILLGVLTDTLDITGNTLKKEKTNFSVDDIKNALKSMIGTYIQTVPIYSAVKVNGKKLYEYAREGKEVELPKRKVTIKSLELISDLKIENGFQTFKIRTTVSKGTYIRALINDIASKLNTVGTMSNLVRVKQGNIDIKEAYTLAEIMEDKFQFYSLDALNIYTVDIDEPLFKKIKNGVMIDNIYNQSLVLFKYNGKNIAIYKKDENKLKMFKYLL